MTGARMHASAGEVADRIARFLRAPSALRAATIAVVLLAAAFLGPRATMVQVTLLYGGLTGLLLWRHPGLAVPALLLATAFVPVEIGTGTESSVNVAIVGVAGITALWVLSMLVERRLRWRRAEPNAAWVALVLVAGARLYPGLQGVVYFNKKTGAPSVTWMEENPPSDAPQSEPAYGYVSLSPKTLIGQVQIPRQLLVMSSIDVEAGVVSFGTRQAAFPLEPFARYCLLNGLDELAFLLSREREIAAFEAQAGPAPWRSS